MTQNNPKPDIPISDADGPHSSAGQKFWFTVKAIEIRLRFIAVLVGIGLVIGYWDSIQNHWDKWTRPAADSVAALPGGEEFYCPMHPSVVRDSLDPGGAIPKCPICGMPLSKRKKGESAPLAEGVLSRVQLSPYRVQLAGIKTVEVAHRPLVIDVRALGVVTVDERKLSRIVVRAMGYVEKLFVNESFTQVC
jgi:Cu(I)/Ag(I) efflux system membrane fusion protein